MLNKTSKQVKSGDLFVDLGITRSTWKVVGVIEIPPIPKHVRIKKLGGDEVRLTSISALLDKAFYKRNNEKPVVMPELQTEMQRDGGDRISSLFGKAERGRCA